jgi:hypothetical protein
MTRNYLILALVAGLGLAAGLLVLSRPAAAFVPPLGVSSAVPAIGPGYVDSWAASCTTTAAAIVPAGTSVLAFECSAPESAETGGGVFVAIGDSAIADPAFATRTSPVICGDSTLCNRSSLAVNARQGYCRADTGTVSLFCWGLTAQLP